MWSYKRVFAVISSGILFAWIFLPLIQFGPVLQDEEFEQALLRADQNNFEMVGEMREYPFSTLTRAEVASRYVSFAQASELLPVTSDCTFNDIDALAVTLQSTIRLSCQYGFFRGVQGGYFPNEYLTKSSAIVALIRGMMSSKEFPETTPYRDPYVTEAYTLGITNRPTGPYLEYPITKYELLLLLFRASQLLKK